MRPFLNKLALLLIVCTSTANVNAQEFEAALPDNALLEHYQRSSSHLQARTELTMPFFEDFTDTGYYPLMAHWQDSMVYINQSMGLRNRSFGVATFDAIDAQGLPYASDIFQNVPADSLTSQYFDLSAYDPSDSIYLSFLFQGRGNGFAPAAGDSLMLYFQRSNGAWVKVWDRPGASMEVFETAMVPVRDTMFFHSDFRFRWVNKATFNIGNSHWHLDYIKMDADRNFQDTVGNDVAFSYWGNANFDRSLTGEYASMPYAHFNADRDRHLSQNIGLSLWNSWYVTKEFSVTLSIKNAGTGASYNAPQQSTFALYNDAQNLDIPITDNASVLSTSDNMPLIVDMKAYISEPLAGDHSTINDTIRHRQVFDNYFAYDDGTAESAFFMSSFEGAPSYVAQEYALTVDDTLRGVDIYFPRQLPDAGHKLFFLQVYKRIDAVGGVDEMVYQQTDLYPEYQKRVNGFVRYRFDNAVPMPAGSFYVALMFPAGGMSDTLYIGLDKNKQGANYRYFKVAEHWQPSLIGGALMLRPLVGGPLPLSSSEVPSEQLILSLYPNPVQDQLEIAWTTPPTGARYRIIDILGRTIRTGSLQGGNKIDCAALQDGPYFLTLWTDEGITTTKKFYKISKQ